MGRLWMWVLGGAGLLWAIKASAQTSRKLGDLTVTVAFPLMRSDPTSRAQRVLEINKVLQAVLSAKTACPGLPPITGLLNTSVSDPPASVVTATFAAEWTHDTLGPIKEVVRQCLLRHLQSIHPEVRDVSATRTS
jgi:hypothetical protein